MVFDLEFNEFYYGKDDFDQKSLMKGLDLVTSRLYAERKTDDLIWVKDSWLRKFYDAIAR